MDKEKEKEKDKEKDRDKKKEKQKHLAFGQRFSEKVFLKNWFLFFHI